MGYKVHYIKKYNYSFDARAGGPGSLQLWGNKNKIAEIKFVNDNSPIPSPIISDDLNSATLYFNSIDLSDIIFKLRHESPVGLTIRTDGPISIDKIHGLADSLVICSSCDPDLLAAKTRGIKVALNRLVDFCGADVLPRYCPVTIHLDDDDLCSPYIEGETTGNAGIYPDEDGLGKVCLYFIERWKDSSLPWLIDYAKNPKNQILAVHEAMHIWFRGRVIPYRITEGFCNLVSKIIKEFPDGPEYCNTYSSTPDDHPAVLIKYLCEIGLTTQGVAQILRHLAQLVAQKGRALSNAEFANLVTNVLGQDAVPAFRSAGIAL